MLVALVVFVVVLAIFVGSYWIFVASPEQRAERAVRARLRKVSPRLVVKTFVKNTEPLSRVHAIDRLLERWHGALAGLESTVARSGMKTTMGTVVLATVFAAVVAMLVVAQLTSMLPLIVIAGAGAACIPSLVVRRAAAKRLAVFEEQFPEAVDLIARALRAGHALPTALQLVGEEIPPPVGSEFRLLADQQNFGMSFRDALRAFAERIPLLDARFFVTAVLTQREMGGNLSEVLDRLAAVIRERFKVKRHVRAVSAHGRITGLILGLLPPTVAGVLFVISPEHVRLLVDDPLGVQMVIVAVILQVIGVFVIRRIVNVEF